MVIRTLENRGIRRAREAGGKALARGMPKKLPPRKKKRIGDIVLPFERGTKLLALKRRKNSASRI